MNKKKHSTILCSKNVEGSSKAMEAHGASVNVNWLFNRFHCYVHTVVMDDDSSTKNVLKRKYSEVKAQAEAEGKVYDWPVQGKKTNPSQTLDSYRSIITILYSWRI